MLPQIGCKVYKSEKMNRNILREKLETYREERYHEGIYRPLIENVEEFSLVDNGVKFKFLYDYVVPIPYRDETQKILRTASAEIKIIDPQGRNLYLVYASSKIADSIRVRLSRILSNSDDFIEKISIPPVVLRDIENNDVVEVKYGWWDDIETYARKGALKGNLSRSRYYSDFESSGKPTLITFESQSTGRTIRLSTQGIITFYGQNVTQQEIEDYIMQMIIPRLKL